MLRDKLLNYKNKRITLAELESMSDDNDIFGLIEEGYLTPVKSSGTNGNLSAPLYKKYNIIKEKKDYSDIIPRIKKLHPKLVSNGYLLKNPEKYLKMQELIEGLDLFLCRETIMFPMSRRERSFDIFCDEKMLDNNISVLKILNLSEKDLGYYNTPEQCFPDYIIKHRPGMKLLICENKDIWFNIRLLMNENGKTELFGVHLDGVVFGQGNDVTGKEKLVSYANHLGAGNLHFLYCGDIDRAGFDIFERLVREAAGLDIKLFVPVYKKMLELAENVNLPDSDDDRKIIVDKEIYSGLFTPNEAEKISKILEEEKRLPQEIINYSILKDNMR